MTNWRFKPNSYQLLAIAALTLSACSNEPLSDVTNLADTTTIEQTIAEQNDEQTIDAIGTTDDNIDSSGTNTLQSPIVLRIETLVGRTLLSLNQSINQGQQLSAQQEQCISTFDPALGESLLSIDCQQPLATGDVAIYVKSAAFNPTENCHADVFANQYSSCTVAQAELTVNTLWTQPTGNANQASRRPVPVVGASISYAVKPNVMTIENLPAALSGIFSCDFDINTQMTVSGDQAQNCDQLLQELVNLIDLHLL